MVSAEWNATMKQWRNDTDIGITKYQVLSAENEFHLCQLEYYDLQLNSKKIP